MVDTATTKVDVTRSASIGLEDVTLDGINAAGTKVGAPTNSRVQTGGSVPRDAAAGTETGSSYFPYSVTFSWTDKV